MAKLFEVNLESSISILSLFNKALTSPTSHFATSPASSVLEEVWETASDVDKIIQSKGLVQIQDESLLEEIAQKVIDSNPDQVAAYKSGKDKLFGFFVGQVMKETEGKANPQSVNKIISNLLS